MTWVSRLWARVHPERQAALKQRLKDGLVRLWRKVRGKVDTRLGDNN